MNTKRKTVSGAIQNGLKSELTENDNSNIFPIDNAINRKKTQTNLKNVLEKTRIADFTFPYLCRCCSKRSENESYFLRQIRICRDCFVIYSTVRLSLEK